MCIFGKPLAVVYYCGSCEKKSRPFGPLATPPRAREGIEKWGLFSFRDVLTTDYAHGLPSLLVLVLLLLLSFVIVVSRRRLGGSSSTSPWWPTGPKCRMGSTGPRTQNSCGEWKNKRHPSVDPVSDRRKRTVYSSKTVGTGAGAVRRMRSSCACAVWNCQLVDGSSLDVVRP